jgi:hypothetical protein
MFVVGTGVLDPRRYLINFPTKQHWRSRSRLAGIRAGLDDLVRVVRELGSPRSPSRRWAAATAGSPGRRCDR